MSNLYLPSYPFSIYSGFHGSDATSPSQTDVQAVKLDTKIKRSREADDEYGTKRVDSREVYGALIQGASTTMLLDGYDDDRDRQAQRALKLQSFLEDETQTSLTLSLTNVWFGAITILVWLASGYCFYQAKE